MSALDFSQFKKIKQDKKSATLMHPNGHEIKISIVNLSPALKKKLEALPLHQAEPEAPVEALDNNSPAQVEEEPTVQPAQAPAAAPAAPAAQEAPMPALQEEPVAQEPAQAPAQEKSSATRPAFESEKARLPATPLLPEETPEEHYAKEVAFQQDLANRHIEPKTMRGMFAKKDTLGKIGTIFGLLLSGAGAGLTHQSNALLDMMNKEIDRDLDAQKTSKANANTFLKTQIDHDLAQSQMLHASNENARLQQDIAASKAANAGLGQANRAINKAKTIGAHGTWDDSEEKLAAQTGGDLLAKNKMLSVAAQHLDDISENHPAAKQMVQTVIKPTVDAEIKNNVVKAHGLKAAAVKAKQDADALKPNQASNDVIDFDKYHKMRDQGSFNEAHGIPINSKTDITDADDKNIQASITDRTKVKNNYKDVMDAYQALASLPAAGQTLSGDLVQSLSAVPWIGDSLHAVGQTLAGGVSRPRDQILDALATRLAGNGASTETIKKMKEAMAPGMFDSKETLKKGPELVYQHFNHLPEYHSGALQKYGLDSDLPEIKFDPIAAQKQRETMASRQSERASNKKESSWTDSAKNLINSLTGGSYAK